MDIRSFAELISETEVLLLGVTVASRSVKKESTPKIVTIVTILTKALEIKDCEYQFIFLWLNAFLVIADQMSISR